MNRYLIFISLALLSASSCLKVETVKLCNDKISTPQIAATSYNKTTGQLLQISATIDTTGKQVVWISPTGTVYYGLALNVLMTSTIQSGTWSVFSRNKVDSCESDRQNFTVNVTAGPPPCPLTGNYFKLGTNSASNVTSSTCGAQTNYFGTHFISGSSVVFMDVTFHDPPVDGGAYSIINTTNVNNIHSGECAITSQITGTGFCYGQSGLVYTNFVSGKLQIVFCGVTISNGSYSFPNSQAILLCN